MKIVCDSCGAKYSIADEKVAGKIFKIRCKKCSSVLEVRGDQTGAQALDSVGEAGDQEGWYVVIDGSQQGPLSPSDLRQRFEQGSVGLDAYVWKEGFDDWKVAGEVPELMEAIASAAADRPSETAKISTGSDTGTGGDLFSEGHGREPTSEIDPEAEGIGDFDQSPTGPEHPAQSPFAVEGEQPAADEGAAMGVGAMAAGGIGAASSPMTGQRNENSVLFSLSNLQQLASRGGSAVEAPTATPDPTSTAASPQASGEGSGLIDIRALAKATTPGSRTAPQQAVDDLLAIGTGPAGGTLAGPLLGPAPAETSEGNRWLWIAAAAVALLAIVGAGIGVGIALGGSPEDGLEVAEAPAQPAEGDLRGIPTQAPVAAAVQNEPVAQEPAGAEAAPAEAEVDGVVPIEDDPAVEEPDAQASESSNDSNKRRASASQRRRRPSSKDRASASQRAAAAPAPPPKKRSGGNLDSLMDEVVGGAPAASSKGSTQSKKSTSSNSSLPEAPSRGDVKTALQGVSGAVKACNSGESGTAIVEVVFSGSTGRVGKAKIVSGPFKGTPVGACVESAVKRARVPRFQQSIFEVKFPYRL